MSRVKLAAAVLVLAGGLLFVGLHVDAEAAPAGACNVKQAQRDVRAAKRALVKAQRKHREAKRVLAATRKYTKLYGSGVGRWTRLGRRTGWPWPQLPMLMRVIHRESRGNPRAMNSQTACAGLLQIHPCHGVANVLHPPVNLRAGLRLWRASGWQPWGF